MALIGREQKHSANDDEYEWVSHHKVPTYLTNERPRALTSLRLSHEPVLLRPVDLLGT